MIRAFKLVAALLCLISLAACAAPPSDTPLPFSQAIAQLTNDLMAQYRLQHIFTSISQVGSARDSSLMVIDPFVDAGSGNVTQTSLNINAIATPIIQGPPNNLRVETLNSKSFAAAGAVLAGSISYDAFPGVGGGKLYRINGSIVNPTNGSVLAHSYVWLTPGKLPSAPVSAYRQSPMFLKDAGLAKLIDATRAPAGSAGAKSYVGTLQASAITADASEALDRGDYATAVTLYRKSLATPEGVSMKNYAFLYQALYFSGHRDEASSVFYDLFSLSVANNQPGGNFLFLVDSTEFTTASDLRNQYELWLRQIAKFIAGNDRCMTVVGNTSHTGQEDYNMSLSKRRADRIVDTLKSYNASAGRKLDSLGRGWLDNRIGKPVDDDETLIDRRVEFRMRPC